MCGLKYPVAHLRLKMESMGMFFQEDIVGNSGFRRINNYAYIFVFIAILLQGVQLGEGCRLWECMAAG